MHQKAEDKATKASILSIIGSFVLIFVKASAGILGNSYALIADAIESATDVLASFLVFLGIRYAKRPADQNHPYGHGRIEPLITFIVVGIMIVSACLIAYQAIQNIQTPHDSPKPFTLIVLGVVIAWKEIAFQIIYKKGKEINSTVLIAEAWHNRSDAISSVAAFIGISIAVIMGNKYAAADDWAALFSSLFILYNCYHIFRPALGEIMDEDVYHDLENDIRKIAAKNPDIVNTEKCKIRKAGFKFFIELHVVVDANITVKEGHDIAHTLKDTLMEKIPTIGDVLIHIEPAI